ncbi:signal peptide peptidase SppA [Deferribacter autotrophicus]|uniref:Signal peptide peptidase SppA n=1 Tax=Deferribacter autotrophicus TaxID=500465 RepID=A0A5A8F1J8_9BACT|nr:signal peptide peptidase SppA [Deferribacter autotrophicus]KAA0257780.1 signal peptide peptidase SppA [Deferribacter autotrophicus]
MKWVKLLFKFILFLIVIIFFIEMVLMLTKGDSSVLLKKPHVLVVELNGVIVDSKKVTKKLERAEKDEYIKGVILKINSPGGAVAPSQEIYRFIRNMKKPVYAAISTLGASGGYYVASACDKIFALSGSITGSIGVIMKFSNLKELYDKIGIKVVTIKSGKFKDIGSSSREMTKEEKRLLENAIKDVYNQFVEDIIKARSIKRELLLKYADGRILTGNQAKKIGLIDAIGTYRDAFISMKKDFHFSNDVILYEPEERKGVLREFLEGVTNIKMKFEETGIFYYLYEN